MDTTSREAPARDTYLTIAQVLETVPGLTREQLAQLRFNGKGPRYRKLPGTRTVLYAERELFEWIESGARQGTASGAS